MTTFSETHTPSEIRSLARICSLMQQAKAIINATICHRRLGSTEQTIEVAINPHMIENIIDNIQNPTFV